MAKRCEHCKFWCDSVFKGETPSGWGIWWGDCVQKSSPSWGRENMHSLFFACEAFVAKEEEVFTTKEAADGLTTKEHEGFQSEEVGDDGEPDFTLDDLEWEEAYPDWRDWGDDDDWDDDEWHGLECTCDDCLQNHPEREIYLDDEAFAEDE